MKRREFLQYSSAATTAGVLLARSDAVARSDGARPNIIFLMTDQQRWDALGVVNPHVKTPNLDRLAEFGVRFSQAVCQAPLCVASRNSLMSRSTSTRPRTRLRSSVTTARRTST